MHTPDLITRRFRVLFTTQHLTLIQLQLNTKLSSFTTSPSNGFTVVSQSLKYEPFVAVVVVVVVESWQYKEY